ncbi:hypothetical protein RFF05_08315 [Bengtsoniella intestinalis]|uniref:hypothetical protein n=1 Tax=Bengtsoniella intestinalis TaxID=3073143 RepID=UPI00391F7EF4
MKQPYKIGILLACIIALIVATQMPYATSVEQCNLTQLPEEFAQALEAQVLQDGGDWQFDTVLVAESRYLFTGTHTTLYAPAAMVTVRDVGTAGTSDWAVGLKVEQMTWVDGVIDTPPQSTPNLSAVTFDLSADSNTWLRYDEGVYGVGTDIRPILVEPTANASAWQAIGASTVNSAITPNATATATVTWQGTLTLDGTGYAFQVSAEDGYINNAG